MNRYDIGINYLTSIFILISTRSTKSHIVTITVCELQVVLGAIVTVAVACVIFHLRTHYMATVTNTVITANATTVACTGKAEASVCLLTAVCYQREAK